MIRSSNLVIPTISLATRILASHGFPGLPKDMAQVGPPTEGDKFSMMELVKWAQKSL